MAVAPDGPRSLQLGGGKAQLCYGLMHDAARSQWKCDHGVGSTLDGELSELGVLRLCRRSFEMQETRLRARVGPSKSPTLDLSEEFGSVMAGLAL